KIASKDFEELSGIIDDFEKELLNFLTDVRDEYTTDMNDINKIKGLFRYNLYAQEFEMIYDRDIFTVKAPLDVQSITLSNKKFIYGFFIEREFGDKYLGSSYFEVLDDGGCKLLMRHDVKIKSNSGPVTHKWAGSGTDSFTKFRQLYYQKGDGAEVKLLKKRKKYLKEAFADRYDEEKKYIRFERLNIKDEDELSKVFAFYNYILDS
ncbi:MAG: hypothetical protein KAR20_06325, partial [Candidatus Heimdallarchaeota archaeon]|nr:hypothetical protein [Candidatus Heimdallarchaeota archaeon]